MTNDKETEFRLPALPCSSAHGLIANMPDGDCGFWSLAPSSFGGLFRSGKSSGSDRIVAATALGSWLLASSLRRTPLAIIRSLNYGVVQMKRLLQAVGRDGLAAVAGFGDFALFLSRAVTGALVTRQLGRRWMRAVHEQGVCCIPVVTIVGLFAGLVLGLQGYYVLTRFGSAGMLGTFVSLTLTRELAPVLAALMIVGQAGSAMAAEIGIHRNSEQIDALVTMGIDPLGYLITPRLFAALIVFPILTVAFTLVGLAGGYLSGSALLGLDGGVYWSAVHSAIRPADVRECILKALIFGLITMAICCHSGFTTHRRTGVGGSRAVSASTTRGVVLASVATLAADYLITSFLV
ncbi:MAG: phospholipid/cholesterol/gamma-HCH transport system permease protein [Verrucomicrobiota bacterium]